MDLPKYLPKADLDLNTASRVADEQFGPANVPQKRTSFDIPVPLLREFKELCARHEMKMRDVVVKAIETRVEAWAKEGERAISPPRRPSAGCQS